MKDHERSPAISQILGVRGFARAVFGRETHGLLRISICEVSSTSLQLSKSGQLFNSSSGHCPC